LLGALQDAGEFIDPFAASQLGSVVDDELDA